MIENAAGGMVRSVWDAIPSRYPRVEAFVVMQSAYVGLTGAERQAVFDEYKTFMSDYDECRERLLRHEKTPLGPPERGRWCTN